MHPGKLTTPRTFIERACSIMTMAYHISNNGGPEVFVGYSPHVGSINVYCYEPKWVEGASMTWMMDAYERHTGGDALDAIEARLIALLEQFV